MERAVSTLKRVVNESQRCDGVNGFDAFSIVTIPAATSSLNSMSVTSTVIFPLDKPANGNVIDGDDPGVRYAAFAAITRGDCSSAEIETMVE